MAWLEARRRTDGGVSHKVYWRDPSGRTRTKTFRTKKDAERYQREVERQLDFGTYVNPDLSKTRFEQFWDHYIRTSPPAAESTKVLYRGFATKYILPRLGQVPLHRISKSGVKVFLAEIEEAGAGKSAVGGVYRLLRHVLAVAVEDGYLTVNPARAITVPKVDKEEQHFLEPEQLRALSRAVDPRYEALILFLGYTGVRIGEAAGLRVSDMDLVRRRVQIVRASKEVEGRLVVGPTKSRRNRSIELPSFLVEQMVTHLKKYSVPKEPSALVFTGPQGAAIRQNNFRTRVVQPAARRLNLPDGFRTHDLRHTAVAIAVKADMHPKQIQEMLGHSSIEVTLGTYGHLFKSLHADSAAKLDALFRAADVQDDVDLVRLAASAV
jgi:integrase